MASSSKASTYGEPPLHPQYGWTMRFRNAETERFFVEIHADMLARNVFKGGLACAGASVIVMASLIARALPNVRDDATWRLNFATAAACLGISIVLAAAAKMKRFLRLLGPQTREVGVMTLVLMLAAVQFALDPWYGAKILRREPQPFECHQGNFSDTRPVLVLSIFVLASHLALPIRWICLLPLEMALGCLYAGFAFLLGGPDGEKAWSTFLLFQGLIFCAVIGRRTLEDYQRHQFCVVIMERNLRAQSEFCLAQQERPPSPARRKLDEDGPYTSEGRSRPETTPSCLAFEVHDEAEGVACLDRLIDLGRQEQWYVNYDEIQFSLQVLGVGGYGVVVAGEYHGSPVAIKINKLAKHENDHLSDEDRIMSSLNEVRIMRRLRHPNIALLHGVCLDAGHANLAIVLEYIAGRTLEEMILEDNQKKGQLQPSDRLQALFQISCAIRYLHSREPPVVHGDFKASNIIAERVPGLNGFHRMKLLDFGLARTLTRHAKPLGGTLVWVAPEVVLYPHQPPHVAADVFSFGRVAFFVLTGSLATADAAHEKIIDQIKKQCTPILPWPSRFEPDLERCRSHVDSCTEFQACLRPSMEKVGKFFESTIEDKWYASSRGEDGRPTSQSIGSIGSIRERLTHQQQVVDVAQPAQKTTVRRAGCFRVKSDFSIRAVTPKAFSNRRHTIDTMSIMPRTPESERPVQSLASSRQALPHRPMFLSDRPWRARDVRVAWNLEEGRRSLRGTWFKTTPTCPQPALESSEEPPQHTFSEYMSE
mmetsp:Transcript_38662/g.111681  ORF Transcript_38662/g.111681 Transcript_38662/m.111681 type:complete len:765 (-) Transcript_38662:125-2419(-)